ncbi:amylo-alpha-1,6-glucosidase [Frondihabitans sp. PAMC 28766]|uniref:glycogen debranching N-terminal domain-containing protein n=1 Tax=Frondihabitans sp. PAMC 28766 TaxID=1795630 RepID=UPI00078D9137|nr:glycogen debranching N-terminal domain-containing protein [Frondihabitans sp. PAMC 28766]AMM19119.1 amylo-alpha-1,6-glucosidase [Frondihabitans sp. PAMC 28766]
MTDTLPATALQPFLDAETVVLRAPAQAWSASDGTMGGAAIHGVYLGDVRIASALSLTVGGDEPEPIATVPIDASTVRFESLLRLLDDPGADPDVRASLSRTATTTGIRERVTLTSRLDREIETTVTMTLRPDITTMELVKSGLAAPFDPRTERGTGSCAWSGDGTHVTLDGRGATIDEASNGLTLAWPVVVPAHGATTVGFDLDARATTAVVAGVTSPARWGALDPAPVDDRLARWLDRALDDLDALRLTTASAPGDVFLAAGAPWFFTLFGRDSIWAARFLLPVDDGLRVARGTLRVLAGLQGTSRVAATAEQPGKIMHELRSQTLTIPGEGISLPPLYFGTVDATALWICLLHDAWRWGLPDAEVRELLPHLTAALEWMRDYGDSDGDGLLEYVDETGHGLSNQGWKDSGDSVQWQDGALATGPIALVEVQAYAYEAAMAGASLLDRFGSAGSGSRGSGSDSGSGSGSGDEWRAWAARLRARLHETFWISDPDGDYLAIALDADKRAVDTVTSNLGHVLGTGILSPSQAALIARRLVSPQLSSGFGLRTMSTDSAGYWPLSYHGGSVWTHDTAIAISGLAREGFADEAATLSEGLLSAAPWFDYRMPELHSGDAAHDIPRPVPYPAACRPQAWSAAASVAVWQALAAVHPPRP